MSSWTDNQIVFSPYIQQLPVEALTSVGIEKQRRYDVGVEKIQSAIDNIAGLDIMKDADKSYLHSLLSDVGGTLKTVAMGDFSNNQLVNSMTGMVGKIGKDQNIQNAVYSTYNIRKQLSAIEDAKINGKGQYGIENEAEYLSKLNSYMSSQKIGEKFDARYTPYIDVNKKLLDIAKEVGIDEMDVQQLYDTDANGNIIVNPKTGMPSFNPIMAEKILKGKDASKILSAFQNALTPADYNQLGITGRYVNQNLTPEDLKQKIISSYGGLVSSIDTQLQDINLKLFEENSKNKKDNEAISSLNKQKEIFELQKDRLLRSRRDDLYTVDRNPDAVRANLYINTYLTGMSKALSSMTEQTKYSVSPQFTVTMDLNRFNRDIQRDKIADYHWSVEQLQKEQDREYNKQKDALEMWMKYGIGNPPAGFNPQQGVPEPIDLSKGKFTIIDAAKSNYQSGVDRLNDLNYKLTTQFFKEANPKKAGQTDDEYNRWIADQINKYAQSTQEGIVAGDDSVNTFTARFAGKQIDKWKKNSKSIPQEFRGMMAEQDDLSKELSVEKIRMEAIREEAQRIAKEKGLDYGDLDEIQKAAVPTDIVLKTDGSHQRSVSIHLSKEDVINLAQIHPEVFNRLGNLTVDKTQAEQRDIALKNLTSKWGEDMLGRIIHTVYEPYLIQEAVVGKSPVVHLVGSNFTTVEAINKIGKIMRKSDYSKVAEIEAQLYMDKGYVKQPLSYSLKRAKENEDDVNNKLVEVISKYKGDMNEDPSFDTEEMIKTALSGKPNAVKFIVTPSTSERQPNIYTMEVFGQNGKSQSMVINEDEFTYLTKTVPPKSMNKPKVLEMIDTYGTTGLGGSNSPESAYFTSHEFKNLSGVDYTVTGNLIPDMGNPNLLWFKLFVHTPDGKTTPLVYDQPIPRYVNGSYNPDLDRLPEGINSTVIESLIKANK